VNTGCEAGSTPPARIIFSLEGLMKKVLKGRMYGRREERDKEEDYG